MWCRSCRRSFRSARITRRVFARGSARVPGIGQCGCTPQIIGIVVENVRIGCPPTESDIRPTHARAWSAHGRAGAQINVYSSPDLASWTYLGDAFAVGARPAGIYFRPKVVYNAAARAFVLWVNRLPTDGAARTPLRAYPNASFLVATRFVETRPSGRICVRWRHPRRESRIAERRPRASLVATRFMETRPSGRICFRWRHPIRESRIAKRRPNASFPRRDKVIRKMLF